MAKQTKRELELAAIKNYLIPYLNLHKQHPLLPGAKTLHGQAAFIGIDEKELGEARQHLLKLVKTAALDLLKDADITDLLDKLPFSNGDVILVIGDSTTDDLQGWFEIFRQVVEIGKGEADIRFSNAAVYGSTTSDALRRVYRDITLSKPSWVIIALGSIDAQRLHGASDRTLTSLADFWENLNSIETIVRETTTNPIIWITPPPVITELMEEMPLFEGTISESDLSDFREVIAGKAGYMIDPMGMRMGDPPQAWNYLADGFHPSVSGHTETVKAVLRVLTSDQDVVEGSRFEED